MKESLERTNMPSSNAGNKKILGIHLGEKKVILRFEDEKMSIHPNTYTELKLFPGKELTEKDIKDIEYLDELDQYLEYIKKVVIKNPKSESEIKDRLSKKGASKKQIKSIIDKLKVYHLIDDKYLIKETLENLEYRNFGKNKIIETLKKKGFDNDAIQKLEFDDTKEFKKAKNLLPSLERKNSKYPYQSKKQHIYAALLRNGYGHDIAMKVAEMAKPNDRSDELSILKKDYQKVYLRYSKKYSKEDLERKVTEYLLSKGYKYNDIKIIEGEKRK